MNSSRALQCWQLCQVQKLFRYIMTENIISCLGRDLSCMLASRWNLLKRERGLMRSISQVSVRGSGRLWSSSEGSDRTDGAAAGWEACGLRGYGVLKRAPARSRTQRYQAHPCRECGLLKASFHRPSYTRIRQVPASSNGFTTPYPLSPSFPPGSQPRWCGLDAGGGQQQWGE